MKTLKSLFLLFFVLSTTVFAAEEFAHTAISGYDTVAYFKQNAAIRGSGMHTFDYKGQTYLFSSSENKDEFAKNPEKYVPQYGGYCAFGVSKGKKFHSDPTVFAVVNKKLYLNLNKAIQSKWNAEQTQLINEANGEWGKIKSKKVSSL